MPNTKQEPKAPHRAATQTIVQGSALRLFAALKATAAKLAFLLRMLPALYRIYPDERYLAAKRAPNTVAATQLENAADGFMGMAQTIERACQTAAPPQENFNTVIDTMQAHLCNNCTRRAACWSSHYNDIVDGLFALKPALQQNERVGVEDFSAGLSHCVHPAAMASEMTRAYAVYRGKNEARVQSDALRAALLEQYGAVAQALEGLSAQLNVQGTPVQEKTRRVVERFTALGMPPSECAVTQEASGNLRVVVTLPRTGFTLAELERLAREASHLCHRTMLTPQKLSCRGLTTLIFLEKPPLRPVFGVAAQAARGDVSGDAVQQFCHAGSAEMILCDGMGTGRPAAVDGNLAAELTARLRRAGFQGETAARLVNVALSLKSEEESSATLDLVSINLYSGIATLFKAGAASGFVVQGGRAFAVGAQSLPIGILEEVKGAQATLRLQAGDFAVLVSDGMLLDGEGWITAQLSDAAARRQAPQYIANALVSAAAARAAAHEAYRPDDITAAVLQLVRG